MSVLQRKAQAGKKEHQARAMTVAKSLRVGLARTADDVFDMAMAVIGFSQDVRADDAVFKDLAEGALLVFLDGPRRATGGAVLGAPLVTALVQQQTTGKISDVSATERIMTATDAALCAPMLDALFAKANALLETAEDRAVVASYKFGARAEDSRLFALALDAAEYHVIRLTIDIASGKMQSEMTLILPVLAPAPDVIEEEDASPTYPAVTLGPVVMNLRTELNAVLHRLPLSVGRLGALKPGDTLSIPGDAFDDVALMSIDGRFIGQGPVGQVEGQRAMMMNAHAETKLVNEAIAVDLEDDETPSDYSNLDLPELSLPDALTPIEPDANGDLPDLPELPDIDGVDLPELPDLDVDGLPDLPELDDLPDLPALDELGSDPLGETPEAEDALLELEDLPEIKIA
ncbi:MAG: FliM/FliN family flagellar motor C-terminal domain-containing protein [Pseudomonadota bacterium]